MNHPVKKTEPTEQLFTSQRLLLALDDAVHKLEAVERAKTEPIAIVGMSCRFPGGANDPEAFWQILQNGIDTITEVPSDRWSLEDYYDPDPEVPGKMYTRHGGFLQQIDQFDPQFFGISPREAVKLDPQQRLLLEVSWEALEQAGFISEQLAGSQTGVFVGITTNDYARLLMPAGDVNQLDAYYLTGNPLNAVAGRISYTLGLQGPCLAIDTACSSSLVAVHLACQSLRNGECTQAIAGGVNLILTPENTIALSKAKMLSADGRCKTFDGAADGIVRGEGCGVLVLKRLSDAITAGDPILAMIRGSAVNQDGASSGFTVPNRAAQETLIRQALNRAKIVPSEVDYIEAHGTGTPLGDPIEVRALGSVLGEGRDPDHPLRIGSVKTNVGHLESAAGVAGLIKVVLALQHQQIPSHLHLKQPNPYINWDELPIVINTEPTPWASGGKRRIAGVSSFGASGTNAHLLLEEAPQPADTADVLDRPVHGLTLSAKTSQALKQRADRIAKRLVSQPSLALSDVCFTSNTGRGHFKHRLTVVGISTQDVAEKLATFASGQETSEIILCQADTTSSKIAFLFTGQGSQYVGMGRELYATQPVFRETLDRCNQLLRPYLEKPLLDVLYAADQQTLIDETAYTQPALFALEYALYQLWQSWGVQPSVVMGHSVGEYVAACVAGVFSLDDAIKLIATRGRLMQALPKQGAMVAVLADPAHVKAAIAPYASTVAIAAINGPRSLVISGDQQAVQSVCAELEAQGAKTKTLQVSHAFHSPLMEPMLTAFRQVAAEISYQLPQLPLVSNLTGQFADADIATPEYWCRHILSPVQFAASLETLKGYKTFLEVGAKPVLLGMGQQCFTDGGDRQWLPSLRPGQQDWQVMLQSLGALYVHGFSINWQAVDRPYAKQRISLPTYPFQRERFWVEVVPASVPSPRRVIPHSAGHPLLGQRLQVAGSSEIRFESHIIQHSPTFLNDHRIYGSAILPATAYMEMALAAGATVFKSNQVSLENVAIQQALLLSEDATKTLQLVLQPNGAETYTFQIFSLTTHVEEEATWTLHASGRVQLNRAEPSTAATDLPSLKVQGEEEISGVEYYQGLRDRGFDYGDNFRAISHLWKQSRQALGQIQIPSALTKELNTYQLHPVLLDACLQVLGTSFPPQGQEVYLPVGVDRLQVYCKPEETVWSQVQQLHVNEANPQHLKADLCVFNKAGTVVAELTGVAFRRVSRRAFERAMKKVMPAVESPNLHEWLYEVTWSPQAISTHSSTASGSWLIFADPDGMGLKLAQLLQERGDRAVLVSAGTAYQQLQETQYQIDYSKPGDFHRLLQESNRAQNPPYRAYRGMVYLAQDVPADSSCGHVLHLVQALVQAKGLKPSRLWLVTQNAQSVGIPTPLNVHQSSLWGLGRVIALEHPDLHCSRLDLDAATTEVELLHELLADDREDQIAYRQGSRYVARLARQGKSGESVITLAQPFQLKITEYGILENLTVAPMTRRPPAPGEVEVEVRAVGLNFRDVLNALGMLKKYTEQMGIADATDLPFGGECSGRVVAVGEGVTHLKVGDEVIAAQTIGSLASFVNVNAAFVIPKPKQLSFEAAATIPTTFLTAYYGLYRQAKIQPGDRVLIHAAAGGVGQAAVQLAQWIGAEVFATASPSKWDFLKSTGIQHVMNSRSLEFADQVMELTGGQGVDVVLNSLNGDFIPKSLEVLSRNGRFVEIGKLGIWERNQVQAHRPDVAYFPFDLLDISLQEPGIIATLLEELMHAFDQGSLQPLPHKVFPLQDVVNAFRYMAQAKHIGKVVVTLPQATIAQSSEQRIRKDGSYLITGGLGALGLQVARWMVEQGARHLVLTGRRDPSSEIQQSLAQLEQVGTQVLVLKADVSNSSEVSHLLETVRVQLPPLRGIVHAAGVLEDGMLAGQTWESFQRVMAPKVAGAWNLHHLTQADPIDFFVCFSSISALLGSPGQGNYAAANAFMDALAHHRRAVGLPATSINWGPWDEVGMAAALSRHAQVRWAAQGMKPIPLKQGLQVLSEVLEQNQTQVGVLPIEWSKFLAQFPSDGGLPLLANFASVNPQAPIVSEFRQQLEAAAPRERRSLAINHVRAQIARVLDLKSIDVIDPQQGFSELGMDSLMAVELQNRLQTSVGTAMPASLAFDYPTVEALADYLVQTIVPTESSGESVETLQSLEDGNTTTTMETNGESITQSTLDELSDSEAEALLISQLDSMRY